MYRSRHAATLTAMTLLSAALTAHAADFSGAGALEFTRRAVALGSRPSGSPALARLHQQSLGQLRTLKCQVSEDNFTAQTPVGPVAMKNIIARFPGTQPRAVVISGHYETSRALANFVGANDGGRIGHSPVRERRPAGEGGARLPRLIADRDDQVPGPIHDRVNSLGLPRTPVYPKFSEDIDR